MKFILQKKNLNIIKIWKFKFIFSKKYFDLIIDLNEDEDKTYSIETIFYINNNELLPKILKIKEKDLILKGFGIQKMKVNNIINIIKDDFIKDINYKALFQ